MTKRSDILAGSLILVLWAGLNIWRHWNTWALDLSAIYFSAWSAGGGETGLIYSPDPAFFWVDAPGPWRALAEAQGADPRFLMPYVYPPIWAWVLGPLAHLTSAQGFFNAVLVVNAAALAGAVALARGILAPKGWPFVLWAGVSVLLLEVTQIAQIGLTLGQPQVLVSFFVLTAFHALAKGRDISAGGLLAIAAAIKVFPAVLAAVFLMERRWRALGAFIAIGAALAGLSVLLTGWDLHALFLERVRALGDSVLVSRINYSFELVLYQLGEVLKGTANWAIPSPYPVGEPGWISPVMRLLLLGGMVAVWHLTRGLARRERLWSRLFAAYLVAILASPLSWPHYLIVPLLLIPGLFARVPAARATLVMVLFTAVFSTKALLVMAGWPMAGFAHVALADAMFAVLLASILRKRVG